MRCLLTILLIAGTLAADDAPRFETSTVTASRSTVHPLETIDFTITIRNTGGSTPSYLRVANVVPASAMFVRASPDWKFIEADRELSWMGSLPPGTSKVLTVSLVTRPESAGLTLAYRVAIHYDGAYWGVDHDLQIANPSGPGAERYVFGYLGAAIAVSLMLFVLLRRSRSLLPALVMIFLSLGFLLLFVPVALRDVRMRSRYAATQCTVLDSMARFTASQAASNAGSRRSKGGGSWSPAFALRYVTNIGETVSIGYASASHLQFGSPKPAAAALDALPRGATAPCWYDPDDPRQVVLTRDLGGAYRFALIPLAMLVIGIGMAVRQLH